MAKKTIMTDADLEESMTKVLLRSPGGRLALGQKGIERAIVEMSRGSLNLEAHMNVHKPERRGSSLEGVPDVRGDY